MKMRENLGKNNCWNCHRSLKNDAIYTIVTANRNQTQNCILDGVILENSGTVPDSLGSDASNVEMDLKSVKNGCMMKQRTGV